MSRLRANQITNENANGAPNFPHGLTVTGVVTATTSATTMSQIVVGSAVTANSNGVDTVGIVTAGTLKDKAGGTFAPNPTTTQGDIIVRGASTNERLAIGSAGQALTVNGAGNGLTYGAAGLFSGVALLQDQKSAGTHGGQPPNNSSYNQRDLNTEVFDTGNFVSISSNNFILTAGTYLIQASIPAQRTNESKALLYNVSDSSTVAYSQSVYIRDSAVTGGHINLTCRFTIGGTKTFNIRQRVSNVDGEGYGIGSGFGSDIEIFTQVLIYKEA